MDGAAKGCEIGGHGRGLAGVIGGPRQGEAFGGEGSALWFMFWIETLILVCVLV